MSQSQPGSEEHQQWHHSFQMGPVVTSTCHQTTGKQSLPVSVCSHYCSSCREIMIKEMLKWTASSRRPPLPFPSHSHAAHFAAFAFILKRRDLIWVPCLCWPLLLLSVIAALWRLEEPQCLSVLQLAVQAVGTLPKQSKRERGLKSKQRRSGRKAALPTSNPPCSPRSPPC